MNRAVLLIGVSRTGGLGTLKAVEDSIDKMEAWALSQGIPREQVIRRTDAQGPVTIASLFKDVRGLAELGTIEQLVVYFAGHGVVNNRSEYWMLSDAPDNAAEAVNVANNISLAQAGAFDHVVLFSDACRTPTQGLQYSRIVGSDIFPNIVDVELERPVDVFFGTSLGAPALEVRQAEQGRQYQAMYTEALLEALDGKVAETIIDGRVRPRPLKRALPKLVRRKLDASGLTLATSQTPDARITSDDDAWLAEIPLPAAGAQPPPPAGQRPGAGMPHAPPAAAPMPPPPPPPDAAAPPMNTREVAQLVLGEALRTDTYDRAPATREEVRAITGRGVTPNADRFLEAMAARAGARLPPALPDRPGFEIHGRAVARATCPDGDCRIGKDGDATVVGVETTERQSQVLLEFDDGTGVVLPVIERYVGVLHLRGGRLDEVWYEPANDFDASMSRKEIEFLRQAIIKASVLGEFALQDDDAGMLAQRMQDMKFLDPALAVYAAYAFHEIGQFRRIGHMQDYLQGQLGVELYDLALLSRALLRDADLADRLVPRLPMLSQGWALIDALRGRVPGKLQSLRGELEPSLWSLYTPDGASILHEWMQEQGRPVLVMGATS